MVRTKRLELLQLAPLEPKSSVSTNFTTSALKLLKQRRLIVKSGAFSEYGVDDGDRTHDNRSHNPVLYQLSYAHHIAFVALLVPKLPNGAPGRTRTCDHPLRRRMLYPAELRALLNSHSLQLTNLDLQSVASNKQQIRSFCPTFFTSARPCPTSATNVIDGR